MSNDERVAKVRAWLAGRLPDDWFEGPVEVIVDREEVTIVGRLSPPKLAGEVSEAERAAAIAGRIKQFREDTRERRIEIASELEHRSDRRVAWGVDCGDRRQLFTTRAAPVMTRLRQPERQVLDTLVDAGVARSRSEALAWCVKLVGQHTEEWLGQLRDAMARVEEVREAGPVKP
jgi:hypothetical protein